MIELDVVEVVNSEVLEPLLEVDVVGRTVTEVELSTELEVEVIVEFEVPLTEPVADGSMPPIPPLVVAPPSPTGASA
jgi:hypothetical protein